MTAKTDILIVTVTDMESRAVISLFRETTGEEATPEFLGDRTYLNLGKINNLRAYMARSEMGTSGLGGAQESVRLAIEALAPVVGVIMVGIAFGIDAEKQAIGDILVSEQLMLYDLQRVGANIVGQPEIIPRGDRPHASPALINRFRMANLLWGKNKVRFGLILSGDKLVDNIDFRNQLRAFAREAVGGEMEGGGLYVACQNKKVEWILVKAICDWADGHKEDNRQDIAARNAAAFVVHAITFGPWMQGKSNTTPPKTNSKKPFLTDKGAINFTAFNEALSNYDIHILNRKIQDILDEEPEDPATNLLYCIINLKNIDVASSAIGPTLLNKIEKHLRWPLLEETTRSNALIIQLLIQHDYYERLSLVANPTPNQIIDEICKRSDFPEELLLNHLRFSQTLKYKVDLLLLCLKPQP